MAPKVSYRVHRQYRGRGETTSSSFPPPASFMTTPTRLGRTDRIVKNVPKGQVSQVKVNSVQEAFEKCFAVHVLKFEILQIT